MANKNTYTWNQETGEAICVITFENKKFIGTAYCSPTDQDMKSQKTGLTIAEMRAQIKVLKYNKDNLYIQLKALKQAWYSMSQSKAFNRNHYETKMLYRQIMMIEYDLQIARQLIKEANKNLQDYIEAKDECYQKIRKIRGVDPDKTE